MPLPIPRPQDQPLHEDVRWLAGTLGRVIQRLEGDDALAIVEELRQACRARRQGSADAPTLDELVARVRELPIDLAALAARILCIADVYDALTTDRPYRKAFSQEKALEIMRSDAGGFDPALFAEFCEVLRTSMRDAA